MLKQLNIDIERVQLIIVSQNSDFFKGFESITLDIAEGKVFLDHATRLKPAVATHHTSHCSVIQLKVHLGGSGHLNSS